MDSTSAEHSLISPTARLVAYWRRFADVPYASEVAKYTDLDATAETFFGNRKPTERDFTWVRPYVAARYNCIMREVDRAGLHQVVELASGLSLRGLAVTRTRSDLTYIETDLEGMHSEKLRIVEAILAQEGVAQPKGLYFTPVNALNFDELEAAVKPLDPEKPLAIVHEGLGQYLSMEEKRCLAQNVYKILQRFGGVWISPDFESRDASGAWGWDEDDAKLWALTIAEQTKRSFDDRMFASDRDVERFFGDLGFVVQSVPMIEEPFAGPSSARQGGAGPAKERSTWNPEKIRLWMLSMAR